MSTLHNSTYNVNYVIMEDDDNIDTKYLGNSLYYLYQLIATQKNRKYIKIYMIAYLNKTKFCIYNIIKSLKMSNKILNIINILWINKLETV